MVAINHQNKRAEFIVPAMLFTANILLFFIAFLFRQKSVVYFQEHNLFENLTIAGYIAALVYYIKILKPKYGWMPVVLLIAIINRELGFTRTFMTHYNILEYKIYVDIALASIFIGFLIPFVKTHFKEIINTLKQVSFYTATMIGATVLSIFNWAVSTVGEELEYVYLEETAEFFVSILIMSFTWAYLKHSNVLKNK